MRYVLDTTAFSAAMRRDSALLKLIKGYRPNNIVTVPPVIAEGNTLWHQKTKERLQKSPFVES